MASSKNTDLLDAVKNGDLSEVKKLIELGVDPNCISLDWNKTRPIIVAANRGHISVMKYLLEQSSLDPNLSDGLFGNTALIDASHAGNTDVVKLLVEDERVDINYKTKGTGITALMQAARYGHSSVVQVLVEKAGLGVNIQSGGGCTPLMLGCMAPNRALLNSPKMMQAMLAVPEVDLSIKDGQGKTALDWARDKELFSVEKMMMERLTQGEKLGRVDELELQVRMLQDKLEKSENLVNLLQGSVEDLNSIIKDKDLEINSLKGN